MSVQNCLNYFYVNCFKAEVQIRCDGRTPVNLIIQNLKIDIVILQKISPEAEGLSYEWNGQTHYLYPDLNEINLVEEVNTYAIIEAMKSGCFVICS